MRLIPGLDSAAVGWVRVSKIRRVAVYDMDRVRNSLESEGMQPGAARTFASLLMLVDYGRDTPIFVEPASLEELRAIGSEEEEHARRKREE